MADDEFWDDVLAHVRQRVLIPVVGPQLVTMVDRDRPVMLSRLIGERLLQRHQLPLVLDDGAGLDEAVRAYLGARGRDQVSRLYRVVSDILAELNPPSPPPLRDLAAITDIPLFISTTFDPLLARAIDAARFDGRHLTRELWFSPNQSTADQQTNARPPAPDEAVVFKLFGEASSTPQYAIHDEDVLEWLHALVSETARLPDWLGSRLRESPLLFVGCHTPDWVGRFLVRLVSKTRLALADNQIFIVGAQMSRHPELAAFFSTFCGATRVQILEADPAAFVVELHRRWSERRPPVAAPSAATPPAAARGDVFISYVREDAAAARRLADAISGLGGDVWLDERRLQPGDRWEDEILEGIRRHVRLFVALISRQTELRDEGYVFREWAEAVKRAQGIPRRRFILPIVIDADYGGNPVGYRQMPGEFTQFHFGRAPEGVPGQELLATLRDEIRAMRRGEPS